MSRMTSLARVAAGAIVGALISFGPFEATIAQTGNPAAAVPGSKPTQGCRVDYTLPGGVKRSGDPCEVRVDPRGRLSIRDVEAGCGISRTCPNLNSHVPISKATLSLSPAEITDGKWLLYVGDTMTEIDCYDTPGMHQAQGSAQIDITSVDPPHGSVRAKVDCVPNVPGKGRKTRDSQGAQATIEIAF